MKERKVVGLDISDTSIKVIEARYRNKSVSVLAYNQTRLKKNIIKDGKIKDKEALTIAIQSLLEKATPGAIKTKNICLGIADYQIFNYYQENYKDGNVHDIVAKNVPIENNNILYTENIQKEKSGDTSTKNLTVCAVYKDLVISWDKFLEKLDLNLISLMSNTQASLFALDHKNRKNKNCLVDIGDKVSSFNISKDNTVVYSHSTAQAGHSITKSISETQQTLDGKNLNKNEAEKIKINLSKENDEANPEIKSIVDSTLKSIATELKTSLDICASKNICITNILLLGTGAKFDNSVSIFRECFDNYSVKCQEKTSPEPSPENKKEEDPIKGNQSTEKKEIKAKRIVVDRASSKSLERIKLDNTYLQASGLCAAYFKQNKSVFTKDKIKKLIQKNTEKEKKAKKEKALEEKRKSSNWIKENPQLFRLFLVIIIGVSLLPLALWFRNNISHKNNEDQAERRYSIEKSIDLDAYISTSTENYKEANIKSRILEVTVDEASSYSIALEKAKEKAAKKAVKHEKIWPDTLSDIDENENLIFPLNLNFLAYNESDISALALKEAKERYGEKEFILSKIKTSELKKDSSSKELYFVVNVVYLINPGIVDRKESKASTSNQVVNEETENIEDEIEIENIEEDNNNNNDDLEEEFSLEYLENLLKNVNENKYDNYIEVLETGVGWLNAREGPGSGYEIVSRITTGEIYELLEENEGWTKIYITNFGEAWVIDSYIKKHKKND